MSQPTRAKQSSRSFSLLGMYLIGITFMVYVRCRHQVLAAPPELLCLILAVAMIAVFHRHLNQTAKLVIACFAILLGQLHRAALVTNPETGLWLVKYAFRLYEPIFIGAALLAISQIGPIRLRLPQTGIGASSLQGLNPERPRSTGFDRLWRRIRISAKRRPLAALVLVMVAVAFLLFVRIQPEGERRPSVADAGFQQIQSSLHRWQLLHNDLTFRLQRVYSTYGPGIPGVDRLRMQRLREIVAARIAKFQSRFHQVRDQLDHEALNRTVSAEEIQFYDAMVCHEALIEQFEQTAAAVRNAKPGYLAAIPFEDGFTTDTQFAAYHFTPRPFLPEDNPRIAAVYDRKAAEARSRLERLKQTRFPVAEFDPLVAEETLWSQPLALSRDARILLCEEFLQRLRSEPWRLDVFWSLLRLKSLDGFMISIPSIKSCIAVGYLILIVVMFCTAIYRLPKRMRHSADRLRSARRTVIRVTRSVLLSPTRNRLSP